MSGPSIKLFMVPKPAANCTPQDDRIAPFDVTNRALYHAWHNNLESTERNDAFYFNTKLGKIMTVNNFTNAVKQFIHEKLRAIVSHLRQLG